LVHLLQKQISFSENSFGSSPKIYWCRSTKKNWLVLQKKGAGSGKKIWVLLGFGNPAEPAPVLGLENAPRGFWEHLTGFYARF